MAAASSISISGSRPSLVSPFSMIAVVPYLVLGSRASILAGPLLFAATGAGLLRRQPRLGLPVLCFVALAVLSALWLAWGYDAGLRHYGALHTHGLIALDALGAGVLAALMLWARNRASFGSGLVFHTLTWCWASWGAFGWLRHLL